jgi:3-deoxy-7-phosphoheptulonate synthase
MIESHLVAGRQELVQGKPLRYGQSITDGCIGWDTTVEVLHRLADAVRLRRDRSQETRVVVGGYAPA